MRKCVALPQPALRSNVFVPTSERNRLEADERNFLGIFHRELHDSANLIVVHVVDDGHDENDFDSGFVHVFNCAKFYVEQIANLAMAVRIVADAVELQIGVTHTRFERLLAEFLALGELNPVGRRLY